MSFQVACHSSWSEVQRIASRCDGVQQAQKLPSGISANRASTCCQRSWLSHRAPCSTQLPSCKATMPSTVDFESLQRQTSAWYWMVHLSAAIAPHSSARGMLCAWPCSWPEPIGCPVVALTKDHAPTPNIFGVWGKNEPSENTCCKPSPGIEWKLPVVSSSAWR